MALTQSAPGLEQSIGPMDFSCHICGGTRTDPICSPGEVQEQIESLRRFHQLRLRNPTESALRDRVTFTQDHLSGIVACSHCGILCRLPRPSAGVITEAYSEDRYGAEHLRSEFELQYRWALAKVQSLQNFIQSGPFSRPLVVEVGSFVGGFLSAGMDRGWKMLGVDPGKEVAAFCRDQGLEVFCGTLMEAPLKTGTVDAVAIWNTFDQLPNPDSTLATARQVLRNHGILVIRVPNGSSFTQLTAWRKQLSGPAKRWVMAALAWNNLLAFPYLYGYTLPAMDQLLARHGFARLAGRPDTLMTLANESTKTWARWEERLVKWGCLTAARLKQALDEQKYDLAPWLDIYYRAVTSVPDSPLTVARESAVGRT